MKKTIYITPKFRLNEAESTDFSHFDDLFATDFHSITDKSAGGSAPKSAEQELNRFLDRDRISGEDEVIMQKTKNVVLEFLNGRFKGCEFKELVTESEEYGILPGSKTNFKYVPVITDIKELCYYVISPEKEIENNHVLLPSYMNQKYTGKDADYIFSAVIAAAKAVDASYPDFIKVSVMPKS